VQMTLQTLKMLRKLSCAACEKWREVRAKSILSLGGNPKEKPHFQIVFEIQLLKPLFEARLYSRNVLRFDVGFSGALSTSTGLPCLVLHPGARWREKWQWLCFSARNRETFALKLGDIGWLGRCLRAVSPSLGRRPSENSQ
jgi:hypothetical protein